MSLTFQLQPYSSHSFTLVTHLFNSCLLTAFSLSLLDTKLLFTSPSMSHVYSRDSFTQSLLISSMSVLSRAFLLRTPTPTYPLFTSGAFQFHRHSTYSLISSWHFNFKSSLHTHTSLCSRHAMLQYDDPHKSDTFCNFHILNQTSFPAWLRRHKQDPHAAPRY